MEATQTAQSGILGQILAAERAAWSGVVVAILVTPELASEWLRHNTHNRRPLANWIRRLVGIMNRGEWMLTPAMIAFDWKGVLLDGQNRLYAIVESEKAAWCLVGYGFDPECFAVIDCGCKRTFAHSLGIDHEHNCNTAGAAYRLLWQYLYESPSMAGNGVPTTVQLLAVRDAHPTLATSVTRTLNGRRLCSNSLLAFCHYLFSQLDAKAANAFMDELIFGANLKSGHPVYVLRERLLANRLAKTKLPFRDITALIFKTWNFVREGRTRVGCLRWAPENGEIFPVVK